MKRKNLCWNLAVNETNKQKQIANISIETNNNNNKIENQQNHTKLDSHWNVCASIFSKQWFLSVWEKEMAPIWFAKITYNYVLIKSMNAYESRVYSNKRSWSCVYKRWYYTFHFCDSTIQTREKKMALRCHVVIKRIKLIGASKKKWADFI